VFPRSRRTLAPLLGLALCGCNRNVLLPAAQNDSFDPVAFFEGHTHGEGELRKLIAKPVHVSVDSSGRLVEGGLILDQTIREAGKPPSMRRWTIKRVAQDRYTGTLTEAVGPVTADVVGPRAHIEYMMRHGLTVEQRLAQQTDGTTVLNRLTVRKLGVQVATLTETIKRVAPTTWRSSGSRRTSMCVPPPAYKWLFDQCAPHATACACRLPSHSAAP
jgi:Protein of unknown function (DUF3833)